MKKKLFSIFIVSILLLIIYLVALNISDEKILIEFTSEELQWMQENPIVFIGPDPIFGPIEFIDSEGTYRGAAADYIKWFEDNTPLEFEVVNLLDWSQILDSIKDYELDMLGAATRTKQREEYLLFTEPYIINPNVIITRNDFVGKVSVEDLIGKSVTLISDYAVEDYLSLNYPEINLIPVSTLEEGISQVSLGTLDYMVVSLAQISYYLKDSAITNLKVSGEVDFDYNLAFAFRDNLPELKGIIDKALEAMPETTKKEIYSKWINIDLKPIVSEKVFYSLLIALTVISLAVLIALVFNHILKVQVKLRTKQLNIELIERRRIEQELAEFNDSLEIKVSERTKELSEALRDLKRVQNELIETEKLSSLSRMLVNISHNLNTSIGSSITLSSYMEVVINKMTSEFLDNKLSRSGLEKQLGELKNSEELISKELNTASDFIKEIKAVSKLEKSGEEKLINFKIYLESLIKLYSVELSEKHIVTNIMCNDDIEVMASVTHLNNIFKNLIRNSIDYGFIDRDNGTIDIEIIEEDLGFTIYYKDDGVGIDESIVGSIYEPLFTTNMNKSSGWGLNILYNTVKFIFYGTVELTNNQRDGLAFKICLCKK